MVQKFDCNGVAYRLNGTKLDFKMALGNTEQQLSTIEKALIQVKVSFQPVLQFN